MLISPVSAVSNGMVESSMLDVKFLIIIAVMAVAVAFSLTLGILYVVRYRQKQRQGESSKLSDRQLLCRYCITCPGSKQ